MNVAFLAPLKPPDHPEPSGDREMARLFMAALAHGGARVDLVSRTRFYDPDGGATAGLAEHGRAEADRWIEAARSGNVARPDLVFTYHVFYKAPDVIGPRIAAAFSIPYVIAEGSRAPKRAGSAWDTGHRLSEAALDAADLVLVLNERDREVLERLRPPRQRLESFPPFVDAQAWPSPARAGRRAGEPVELLAVAMMRKGDKLSSYRLLAEALVRVDAAPWRLTIVGDGDAGPAVREAFAPFGERVRFLGRIEDRQALARVYAASDCLLWPAVNEAFGMVFLEAALQGCPAIAGAYGGVPGVVRHGETGLLVAPGSAVAFAHAVASVLTDRPALLRLGEGARHMARGERSLEMASSRLSDLLAGCTKARSAA